MDFYKSKHGIRTEMDQYEKDFEVFFEHLSDIKEQCFVQKNKAIRLDIIWDEIMKIYSNEYASIYLLSDELADILKKEIILTVYGASIHHSTEGVSLTKWLKSVNKRNNKYTTLSSFSKNMWKPWLDREILPYGISFSEDNEIDNLTVSKRDPKSRLNHMFCNYMDKTVNMIINKVSGEEDEREYVKYSVSQPFPQLIYDIITNWDGCPLNSKYYYGMELGTLSTFRDNILKSRKEFLNNLSTSYAKNYLELYMMEELFGFSFIQDAVSVINDRVVIRSNREDEYSRNAYIVRYIKRIQSGSSQFIRNRIIHSFASDDMYNIKQADMNEHNLLYGFAVPLLEIVYSYFIGSILDEEFNKDAYELLNETYDELDNEPINQDSFYNIVLKVCEEYIEDHSKDYALLFDQCLFDNATNYNLKSSCDALGINITKCIYATEEHLPNLRNYRSVAECIEGIIEVRNQIQDTSDIFNSMFYLRFPFNNIYSEFSYYKEITKYNMVHITYIKRRVHDFLHIKIGKFWYSVPAIYMSKGVYVKIIDSNIKIYNENGVAIAEHTMRYNGEKFVTNNAHIPKGYNFLLKYERYQVLNRAKAIGSNTHRLMKLILEAETGLSEQNLKMCKSIFSMANVMNDSKRMEELCGIAIKSNELSIKSIRGLFENDI